MLDTAPVYGDAEQRLGELINRDQSFEIVTKVPPMEKVMAPASDPGAAIDGVFSASLSKLKVERVHGLMLHRVDDLKGGDGDQIRQSLGALKSSGRVDRVGVSVYHPEDLEVACKVGLDIVQIPASILDQRFLKDDLLTRARDQGIEIHARSALLQGLLAMPLDDLPAYFRPIQPTLTGISERASALGLTRLEAAIGYCCSSEDIDYVVVGAQKPAQMSELCAAAACRLTSSPTSRWMMKNLSCHTIGNFR